MQIEHIHSSAWNSRANKRRMFCPSPKATTQRKGSWRYPRLLLGSGLGQRSQYVHITSLRRCRCSSWHPPAAFATNGAVVIKVVAYTHVDLPTRSRVPVVRFVKKQKTVSMGQAKCSRYSTVFRLLLCWNTKVLKRISCTHVTINKYIPVNTPNQRLTQSDRRVFGKRAQ